MPVYEYKCSACERVFEVHQKISDAPLTACSECGGEVKKLVSAAAFHLKGGGWYADGYSSGGRPDGGKDSKPAAPACSGGAEGGCKNCPAAS
jgi:putative FmdB family regulatory protein